MSLIREQGGSTTSPAALESEQVVFRRHLTAAILSFSLSGCVEPNKLDPTVAERKGVQLYNEGQFLDAIAAFKAAREFNRENPELECYIGRCYLGLADQRFREDALVAAARYCDQAIFAFDHAYGAFPGYVNAMDGKSDALKRKGLHEAALQLADWAVRTCGPRARPMIFQAREYAQNGDVDRALDILVDATKSEPENPAAHAELGRFYARFGKRNLAIASLRRALDLNPQAPGVRDTLTALESSPAT